MAPAVHDVHTASRQIRQQSRKTTRHPETAKRKRGRPPKYRPEFAEQVTNYCLLGATNEELGKVFGVDERTIYDWLVTKPEFSQAAKNGREVADAKVARALYLKATGQWTQPAVKIVAKIEILPDGTEVKSEHIVPYTEHFPPDTAAAFIWLKNRHPERWRDKKEVDSTSTVRGEHKVSMELSEEARRWINEDLAEMGMPLIEPPGKGNGARKPSNGSAKH